MMLDQAEAHFRQCLQQKNLDATVLKRVKMHLQEVLAVKKAIAAARGKTAPPGKPEGNSPKPPVVAAAKTNPPAPTAVKHQTSGGWKVPAGWGATGAGALLLGSGAWMLASWSSDQASLDEKMDDRDDANKVKGIARDAYVEEQESLNSRLNLAAALTSVGVVGLGAGVWMLLTAPDTASAAILPTRGGLTVCLTGKF